MSRWRRFVTRPAAVLSLLLFAGTAILWVRSYRTMDELFLIYKGEGSEEFSSLHGRIRFKHTLPRTGTREGIARISHRANPVASLPPRPWAEDRTQSKWRIFHYDYTYRDATKVAQAKAAIRAYSNAPPQLRGLISLPAPNADAAKRLQTQRQLMIAAMQADLFLATQPPESYWAFTFPMWLLMLPALLLPVVWLVSALRRALRSRAGCCRACGYDLTGNTSGVCPECGGAVPLPAKAAV